MEQENKVDEVVENKQEDIQAEKEVEQEKVVETEVAENTQESNNITLEKLLKENKEVASQFDQKVSKAINTAKEKWHNEYEEKVKEEVLKTKNQYESNFEKTKSDYESKIAALANEVKVDDVEDVITLAKKYVNEETDINSAVSKVIEKYPHFKKTYEPKTTKVGKELESNNENEYLSQAEKYFKKTRRY